MALTLIHSEFRALLESITSLDVYPVLLPKDACFPSLVYSMSAISRDIESNLKNTTISAHVFNVFVVARTFRECHTITQQLLNVLDQYRDDAFLLTLVEDGSDEYDTEQSLYIKNLTVTVRVKEDNI